MRRTHTLCTPMLVRLYRILQDGNVRSFWVLIPNAKMALRNLSILGLEINAKTALLYLSILGLDINAKTALTNLSRAVLVSHRCCHLFSQVDERVVLFQVSLSLIHISEPTRPY